MGAAAEKGGGNTTQAQAKGIHNVQKARYHLRCMKSELEKLSADLGMAVAYLAKMDQAAESLRAASGQGDFGRRGGFPDRNGSM
jgi:hypothetical protein